MSMRKPFLNALADFYKSQAEDLIMFGYIEGVKLALPAQKVSDIILLFRKKMGLSEEDFPLECALTAYQRIKKRFIDIEKTDGDKIT